MTEPTADEKYTIDATPTKEFFVEMLTRDIELIDVVPDLVDNSVDGALRIGKTENFDGLFVRITANKDLFEISDNCGGISVEIASKFAFRFGRPKDFAAIPGSRGLFGVGMKRAIFKLGSYFYIESLTTDSRFIVEQNVQDWLDDPDNWHFNYKLVETELETPNPPDKRGTTIRVTSLFPSISANFGDSIFINRLKLELQSKHQLSMEKGLAITLNGLPLKYSVPEFFSTDQLQPAFSQIVVGEPGSPSVVVRIYAGVFKPIPADCGWHIFCNGRLVLEADKKLTTGWGEPGIPNYHPQYNAFRGYVFFDSADATLLPWNTTKTGIDEDSQLYRRVRQEMIALTKPVIKFLNVLKEEKSDRGIEKDSEDSSSNPGLLEQVFNQAATTDNTVKVRDLKLPQQAFKSPSTARQKRQKSDLARITYSKPRSQYEKVRENLGVSKANEVGEITFDYYYYREIEDNK